MKIAICDDERQDINYLKKCIASHTKTHEVTAFLSAKPFLERMKNGEHFDLLFLDVQMSDTNGWEIAKQLKQAKSKIFIAMVTVHGEYIFDCFDRVDWFAPKPLAEEKIWKILDCAEEKLFPTVFEFQMDNITVPLSAPEIVFFEVQRNDLYIHTTHKVHKVRHTLKKIKEMVAPFPQFVQIHNSYIINLDYYDHVEAGAVVLKTGDALKLSRTYRDEFFDALRAYVQDMAI